MIEYRYLVPERYQEVFLNLQGKVKELITGRLLPADDDISHDISLLVLSIIYQYPEQDSSIQHLGERFFVSLISKTTLEVEKTLKKVDGMAKAGFLKQVFDYVDSKKKDNFSQTEIMKKVNEFYTNEFLHLKEQSKQKKLIADHGISQSSSVVINSYQNLMNCGHYFSVRNLSTHFLNSIPPSKKWKGDVYPFLFHLLDVVYPLNFDDSEKLRLIKAVFCLHSPSQSQHFVHASEIDIQEFLSACFELKNVGGDELLDYYTELLFKSSPQSLDEMTKVAKLFISQLEKGGAFHKTIQVAKFKCTLGSSSR